MSDVTGYREIYIYKYYEQNLLKDFKSVKFGQGWGETCRIPVGADGKLSKEAVMAESTRIFGKAKNLTIVDMLKEKERIKAILNVNDQQFDEMVK